MKAYGGVAVQIHVFLTSALVGGVWSASHSGRFTPWEKAPGTYRIGGWAPESVWALWRRENSFPYRDSNSDPSVVQPVASSFTDNDLWTVPIYNELPEQQLLVSLNDRSDHHRACDCYTGRHNTRSCGDTCIHRTGFDPTIPVLEQ
jgi:hypothetical protein